MNDKIQEALNLLKGDLSYDNRASAVKILEELVRPPEINVGWFNELNDIEKFNTISGLIAGDMFNKAYVHQYSGLCQCSKCEEVRQYHVHRIDQPRVSD